MAEHVGYAGMVGQLQLVATEGSAPARAEAIKLLGRLAGTEHRSDVVAFCAANCADDRAGGVKDAIATLELAVNAPPAATSDVRLPDLDASPPSADARAAYDDIFAAFEQDRMERHKKAQAWLQQHPSATRPWWVANAMAAAVPIPPDDVQAGWEYICTGGPMPGRDIVPLQRAAHVLKALPKMRPLHGYRLLRLGGQNLRYLNPVGAYGPPYLDTGQPTPAQLQVAAEAAGYTRQDFLTSVPLETPWSTDDMAAWAAAILPDLMHIIERGTTDYFDRIDKYYLAVGTLKPMPSTLRKVLFDQALSGRKTNRPLAKAALTDVDGLVPEIITNLSSRKYEERSEAAGWLASLRASDAVEALHKAAAKEKHDVAKGAILTALERMGESIDQYLEPAALLADAQKNMKKSVPSAAAWVDLEALPALHWADGTAVDAAITHWLVVQSIKLKSPAPSPMVRRLFDRLDPEDVETFATTIMTLWMERDLRPVHPEEAEKSAMRDAAILAGRGSFQAMTQDEVVQAILPRYLEVPADSATDCKGMLALVAAGGGLSVVAPSERYLRKWYGQRASQCKALVQMLAWIEEPTATQLVLSVGNRFRTKGIQKEAVLQAELLAERKGWTMEDLAYRTVPDGGFGSDGTQVFDYGQRQFTARLTPGLTIELSNDEGRAIKALPAARQSEDEDEIKAVKKSLTAAKKQIKAAAKAQPLRLHEAMAVQRHFDVDDYQRYILDHPVMSRLASRLVWATVPETGATGTMFRPLDDGTLVGADHDEVSLNGAVGVRLVHGAIDGDDSGPAWREHLTDYEIIAILAQFDRPQLPHLAEGQVELTDCRGAVIDDRRMRGITTKLGWETGPAEDGGSVSHVKRRFPSVGLEARVNVRGLHAMIMEHDVGLVSLEFGPLDTYETTALTEIPGALVVETIADVDQMIDVGEGILEDWESRMAW